MKYEKVALSIVLVSLPCLVFEAMLPAYTKELGYSVFQLSILFSVYSFSGLVMRLVIGKFSDRFSRFLVLCSALLLYGLAYLLLAEARGMGFLLAARMVQGAAGILLTISAVSLITAEKNQLCTGAWKIWREPAIGGTVGNRTHFLSV